MEPMTIALTKGHVALVSPEDYGYLSKFKWTYSVGYAVRRRPGGGTVLMHRVVVGVDGSEGYEVDHADMNRLNNTRGNLRLATRGQNSANRPKKAGLYTSPYKGARPQKGTDLWVAEFTYKGKRIRVNGFKTAEEAGRMYDAMALYTFGEFARVNFPDSQPKSIEDVLAEHPQRKYSSDYYGVSLFKQTGRWKATGPRSSKNPFIGYFDTEVEAARAYNDFLDAHNLPNRRNPI